MARAAESVNACDLPPSEVVFGETASMILVRQKLERVADTNIPVLLQGESGTGKEIMARLLHVRSRRARNPLVKVSCPAIPHSLIETELFGYEKGSFTGAYSTKRGRVEASHLGTLFMDEIGSLDLTVQAKLLQLLQDGSFVRVGGQEPRKVDTRVISAANRDLRLQTQDGTFRSDLFFRINAVTIELPPLRERAVDLPILVEYFLGVYGRAIAASRAALARHNAFDAELRLAGKHPAIGEPPSQLCADRQRGCSGIRIAFGQFDGRGSADRSDEIDIAQADHQESDPGARTSDRSEGAAGKWLEPPENSEVAEDQRSVPALQTP